MLNMTSNRPYLIRAFYDWLVDNQLTPHLVVDAEGDGVVVPVEHVKDGEIVLNIAPGAVGEIHLDNEMICFSARFGGRPMDLFVPPANVKGIYARENGVGMMFADEPWLAEAGDENDSAAAQALEEEEKQLRRRPSLTLVK